MQPGGPSWFWHHWEALGEADRRAAITGYRYRVRRDPGNKWWHIVETHVPVRTTADARAAIRRVEALLVRWLILGKGRRGTHDQQLETALYGKVREGAS